MRYLNVKSYYSFLSSALSVDDIVNYAIKHKIDAIALTDECNMCGALEFIGKCKKNNIKPIIGMEIFVNCMGDNEKFILIAKNSVGYSNLMKLTSHVSYTDKKVSISLDILREYIEGVIVIVPTMRSFISTIALHNEIEDLKVYESNLSFVSDLYFGLEVYCKEDVKVNEFLRRYSKTKLVAINEVVSIEPNEEVLRVLAAIKNNCLYKEIDVEYKTMYFKNEGEMSSWFNSAELDMSNDIVSMVEDYVFDKSYKLVEYECDTNSKDYLYHLSYAGFKKRLNNKFNQVYVDRLNYELSIIDKMRFNDYFLVVYDYVKYAKKNGILVGPGRGSGAGSLVSYVLGIVDIDPIKYNLYFERFLNPERISMPDIDIDFEDTRRDEVVEYIRNKYGNDRVGNIITYQTMAMKQALRDVCRVFGVNEATMNTFSKKIPRVKDVNLSNICSISREFGDFVNSHKQYRKIFDIASKIEGFPRQCSEHAAGVVICKGKLCESVPVMNNGGKLVSQYDKDYLEDMGLLKMDILSLKNLTIINDCIKQINESGTKFSIKDIDINDPKIYEMLNKDLVAGLFQLESSGMRNTLLKVKPSCFEDVAAIIALFRPGPMDMIDEFARRKNENVKVEYFDNSIKDVLSNTYGIIVYQEQVMQISSKIAGFSLGKADKLRKAMSKKDKSHLSELRLDFINGGLSLGHNEKKLNDIFDMLEKFASYGFNRAHSVAYAMIGMQMAYLKYYYPNIFFANLMNTFASSNMDSKFFEYVEEAKKFGVKLLCPSINAKDIGFYNDGDNIRYALSCIKGVNYSVVKSIVDENRKKKFESYIDAVVRLNLLKIRKDVIVTLINAGCFDEFGYSRTCMIDNLDNVSRITKVVSTNDGNVDYSLVPSMPKIVDLKQENDLTKEKELLGIFVSSFPLEKIRGKIKSKGYILLDGISRHNNKIVKVAVFVRKIKTMRDKNGELMAIILVSDESGNADLMLFARDYEKLHDQFEVGKCCFVQGKVQIRNGSCIIVSDAKKSD
jgi:DNA polymerase-3 subunit alpha